MNNEAKSIEIASKVAEGYGVDFEPLAEAALDMAEWKDRQAELLTQTAYESGYDKARQEMKEYLEKRKEEYIESIHTEKDMYDYGYVDAIKEIIDEFFKEESK